MTLLFAGGSAHAKGKGNVDAFLDRKDQKPLAVSADAALARGAKIQHIEERLGVPTFVFASAGAEVRGAHSGLGPSAAARSHLQAHADMYRLSAADVSAAELKSMHDTGKGPRIARFVQSVDGVEVFRNELKVVMDRNNDLVAISGYLAPSSVVSTARAQSNGFRISSSAAVARAFAESTGQALSAQSLVSAGTAAGGYSHFQLDGNTAATSSHVLATPARAKKVYFTMPDGLVAAYYVEINAGPRQAQDAEYASYVVSAADGSLLFRNDLRARESFTYRTFASASGGDALYPFDGPHGTAITPHPTGTPNNLNDTYVPQELVTLPNALPSRPSDFWLPANATQTTGNNVDAYADLVSPDGFQPGTADMRAETTAPLTFDYGYDINAAPAANATQIKAAVVNLFYVNNWLHDAFYEAGFDEASGNAQAFNYGRGGLENDSLRVEAQDVGGRNNANMSTPADGARPRMQMYLFDAVSAADIVPVSPSDYTILSNEGVIGDDTYDLTGEVVTSQYVPTLADGGTGPVETIGCSAPFTNAAQIAGKIALIDRGTCTFAVKALNAQAAGAVAVIIANNVDSRLSPAGVPDGITIPVMGIPKSSADRIRTRLAAGPVTVQMVRTQPGQDRDGTLDNDVVAHEWGHYISNRLVGNSNGLTNNQGRSMGEGWGDFHALLMQVRESDRNLPGNDRYQGVYVAGGWVTSGAGANGHYYGIRRVPYTTDMTKNALTLKHIENGVPLPNIHPTNGGEAGRANSEVHNSGEVWATMLWESYASLLNAHPFQEAQDRMKRYLVAAYKATPNAPTILEARDALLAVAAASDPADYQRFVAAFAKRGAGFGAKVPNRDSQDHIGTVESFATGRNLVVESVSLSDTEVGCDTDGYLDVGETGLLTVTVRNTGGDVIPAFSGAVTSSSTRATFDFQGDNILDFPQLERGQSATRTVKVALTAVTATTPASIARAGFSIAFDAPGLPAGSQTYGYDPRIHVDEASAITASDSVETSLTSWTSSLYQGSPAWKRSSYTNASGAKLGTWHGPNLAVAGEIALTSPWIKVAATGDFTFLFTYRHSFETANGGVAPYYDGAVFEYSMDGLNWFNITKYAYGAAGDAQVLDPSGDNPLGGEMAFAGLSAQYPAFTVGGVGFGTSLAGENIRFRFRIGTDSAVGAYGFELDTIQISGAAAPLPFAGFVLETSDGTTCNRKPVADAGLNRNFNEFSDAGLTTRTVVTLNGTASFDPDGNALTYQWRQVNGPPVTLSANDVATPTFTADVAETTLYNFELVVSDGTEKSAPKQVAIGIINNNRRPVVTAAGPAEVHEGTAGVTLTSSATDADGETLGYSWVQTGGPAVTLAGADTATAQFDAPAVDADQELTFELTVDDPYAAVTSTVTVKIHDNRQPTVTTGATVSANERETVTLTATGADEEDGSAVTYLWSQIGGPDVVLLERNAATLSFTAPDVVIDTELRFSVVAVDSRGEESIPAAVVVTVHNVNRSPTATINVRGDTLSEGTVVLDGSGSSDPDGSGLRYAWKQTSGPAVQLSSSTGAVVTFKAPKLTSDKSQVLAFELTVTDPDGATGKAQTSVTITKSQTGGCSTTGGSPASLLFPLMGLAAWAFASRRRRAS